MTTRRRLLTNTLSTWAASALATPLQALAGTGRSTLAAYGSEAEFAQALQRWRDASTRLPLRRRGSVAADAPLAMNAAPSMSDKAAAPAAESITNVQTAGVDEGGIVKQAGDFLVILRRGRLFTVRVGGQALAPVALLDAYAPGSDPAGAWYDELLVSGATVVVIGYSYARGGTEIGLFQIDAHGGLSHRSTHHLRSFDYYSSRNYASRLIGRTLIFYSPLLLHPWDAQPWAQRPGLRRWHEAATPDEFRPVLPATRIYRTDDDFTPDVPLALHTVTQCDLDAPDLAARSTAVLGPAGRVFYVAPEAVYVWTAAAPRGPRPETRSLSALFRIPLDGSAPGALKTAGVPIDTLSFLEGNDGHLNVLVRESGFGEGMWGAERTQGSMALLRVALSEFGDGRSAARQEHYRALPAPAGGELQNRFIGDWLLWGGESGWALRFAQPGEPQPLQPGHAIERIEALGRNAVLVGQAGADLCFSSVDLARGGARIADRHVLPQAAQGETRTHGFFYRPTSGDSGVLGLPVLGTRQDPHGSLRGAAAVVVLRQRALNWSLLGRLSASARPLRDDACRASCVDWYGNARPVFLGERVFALLGYELVEGRIDVGREGERLQELRRVSFAPRGRPGPGERAWPFD